MLQLEEEVVGHASWEIPAVEDAHLLVLLTLNLFLLKTIVLHVVVSLQQDDSSEGHQGVQEKGLHSEEEIDQPSI